MAQHSFQNGERQPLLQAYETQSRKWPLADKHIRELATFFNLWWPLWLTQLLDVSMIVANVISVGHLGALQLASVQLSTATAGALGRGTLFGLNSGMDTLLTQGWTSSHPQQIGLHAQRQAVIVAIMVVLQLLLFHNAEPILLALHQNADVAHLTSKCLKIQSLFLPFMGMSDIAARWLAAQGRVGVATCVLAGETSSRLVVEHR